MNLKLSYSPETLKLGQIWWFFSTVTLKFQEWPWKTIGHLFYTNSTFIHYFIAIGEFRCELQSENAQIGSHFTIFLPPVTLKFYRWPGCKYQMSQTSTCHTFYLIWMNGYFKFGNILMHIFYHYYSSIKFIINPHVAELLEWPISCNIDGYFVIVAKNIKITHNFIFIFSKEH